MNPNDPFFSESERFISRSNDKNHTLIIGLPFFIEFGRLIQKRGTERAIQILETIKESDIRLDIINIDDIWELAISYEKAKVLSRSSIFDLLHYASASLSSCNCIASWNMTHFNSQRVKIVNEINIKLGLPELIIGTPSKLIGEL
jgi:hypothetical protein